MSAVVRCQGPRSDLPFQVPSKRIRDTIPISYSFAVICLLSHANARMF